MAQVKFGGGIVAMSGKLAGNVFAKNRSGSYVRSWRKPVNPKSSRQVGARTLVMYLAEQWGESPMTDAIRTAWQTYASSFTWLNKLGEQITLTGFNAFMQCNCALINAGGSIVTAAPTVLGLPPGDPTFACTGSEATNLISVVFDDTFDWCGEDDNYMAIFMGQPKPASHNFYATPYRFAASIPGNTAVPITSPQTLAAPFTLIEGQKIWTQARIIRADARTSTRFNAVPFLAGA